MRLLRSAAQYGFRAVFQRNSQIETKSFYDKSLQACEYGKYCYLQGLEAVQREGG
jgi:hypothetical protein